MKNRALFITVTGVAVVLVGVLVVASGCKNEAEDGQRNPAGARSPAQAPGPVVYANVRCPIMSNPIVPANVTQSLTREHKGQKVAFCCGGCPGAWDKLSDADKDAKLAAVAAKK